MVTAIQARTQLSRDLGDYFAGVATGDPCCDDELIDSQLIDEGGNNQDEFLTDRTTVWVEGGQMDNCCNPLGPLADEERRVDRDSSVLSTGTLNTFRNFSNTMLTGVSYELHRLFTAAEKDDAINQALNLVTPIVWTPAEADIAMVADQYDYDMTTLVDDCCNAVTFYNNRPNMVTKVSPSDSEIDIQIHAWEIRNNNTLHLFIRPRAGESLRLHGIARAAVTDLDTNDLLIVSARAAIYLLETAIQSTRVDQRELFQTLLQNARTMYAERVRQFMKPAPAIQLRTEAYDRGLIDVDFGIP